MVFASRSTIAGLAALAAVAGASTDAGAQQGAAPSAQRPAADSARADSAHSRPTSLGTVVVSASRTTTTLERMPLHTTVVTRAQIQQAPARTLDQLLRDVPGMNLGGAPYYTTDPTSHQTRLRGVTNSKVLMLVDGIPVHDPFYSTTQWFKMPMSSIDRVEVVRGGASSSWGNLAVAGVVNVITKKPIDSDATLDLSYQSLGTANVAVAKNVLVGSALALRFTGDVLRTDGYQTTPSAFLASFPGKENSSARNGNAQLAAYFNSAGPVTGFARVGYHQQNEDIGGYAFGSNLQKSPDAAAGLTANFDDTKRLELRGWGQYESFDKSNGAACYLASATSCNTTSTASPLVQYANSHDDNPYRELGASSVFSWSEVGGALAGLQAGADFRAVGGEDRATTYNRPTTTDSWSATVNRTNFGRGTQRFVGVFSQLHLAPAARLDATINLRYDFWTNTDGVAEMTRYDAGSPGTTLGGAIADSHKASFNPSLALRWAMSDHVALRGAAYRSFRAPGLNNLYRTFSSTTSITIANPTLSPETLVGGEVGADVRAGAATLGATWFQYDTRNLIASYRVPNAAAAPPEAVAICGPTLSNCPATVNFNTNSQDAVSRGLELVSSWRAAPRLTVDGSYSFTDSHYTSSTTGDPMGAQLGAIPKHVATLGTAWRPTSRWSAYAGGRWSDAMYLDVSHTIAQPAYLVLDASTSYRLSDRFEVYAAGTNLTDVRYADNATTSATGETLGLPRSLTSGVRLRF